MNCMILSVISERPKSSCAAADCDGDGLGRAGTGGFTNRSAPELRRRSSKDLLRERRASVIEALELAFFDRVRDETAWERSNELRIPSFMNLSELGKIGIEKPDK